MSSHVKWRAFAVLTTAIFMFLVFSIGRCFAGESLLSGFEGNFSTTLGIDWQFSGVSSAFVATGATQGAQALQITHSRTQSIPLKLPSSLDKVYATFKNNTQLRADFTVPATANFREAFFRLQINGGASTIDGNDMVLTPGATVTGIWDYKADGVLDTLAALEPISAFALQLGMRGSDMGSPVPTTSVTIVDNIRWFAPLLGDFNNNNAVDAADYVMWRKNNGTNNALPNDNGLGVPIGSAHYDLWRSNFGNGSPGSGAGLTTVMVPEPSVFLLVVNLSMCWLCRRTGRLPK